MNLIQVECDLSTYYLLIFNLFCSHSVIVHLPFYISFLELIQNKKDSGLFNHIEKNVYKALHNIPTLTKLCVLALYSISISAPYMQQVHGPEHDTANVLILGSLHDKVTAHCQAILDHPA